MTYRANMPTKQEWKKLKTNLFGDKALRENIPDDPKQRQLYFAIAAVIKGYLTDLYGRKNYNDKYKQFATLVVEALSSTKSSAVTSKTVSDSLTASDIACDDAVIDGVTSAVNEKIKPLLDANAAEIKTVIAEKMGAAEKMMADIDDSIIDISESTKTTTEAIKKTTDTIQRVEKQTASISNVVGGLQSFITGMIGGVFGAIASVGKFILGGIFGILGGIIKTITGIITGVTRVIYKTITTVVSTILTPIFKVIGGIARGVWNMIKTPFIGLKNMISSGFSLLSSAVKTIFSVGLKAFVVSPAGQFLIGYLSGILYYKLIEPLYTRITAWWNNSALKEFFDGKLTFTQMIKKSIFDDAAQNWGWDKIFKEKIVKPIFEAFGKEYDREKSFSDNLKIALFGDKAQGRDWVDILWDKSKTALGWLLDELRQLPYKIWNTPILDSSNVFYSMLETIGSLCSEAGITPPKQSYTDGKVTVGDAVTSLGLATVVSAFGSVSSILALMSLPLLSDYFKAKNAEKQRQQTDLQRADMAVEGILREKDRFTARFGDAHSPNDFNGSPATLGDNMLIGYQYAALADKKHIEDIQRLAFANQYWGEVDYAQRHDLKSRLDFLSSISPEKFDLSLQHKWENTLKSKLDEYDKITSTVIMGSYVDGEQIRRNRVIDQAKSMGLTVDFSNGLRNDASSRTNAGAEHNVARANLISAQNRFGLSDTLLNDVIWYGKDHSQLMQKVFSEYEEKHQANLDPLYISQLAQLQRAGDTRVDKLLNGIISDGQQTLSEEISGLKQFVQSHKDSTENSAEFDELKRLLNILISKQTIIGDNFDKFESEYKQTNNVAVFGQVTGTQAIAVGQAREALSRANAIKSKLK